ncbi:MAG: hypothetical protein JSW15_03435 [Deltaproteobacteria bacterium]|nr:MAG: hypothetical protein JSW15_03435 [Deltaproteobacteria bacterium]
MRKRGRRRIWPWLFILLVLVAAGLVGYFILLEREREEKKAEEKRASVREVAPTQKESVPQIGVETPVKEEPTLAEEVIAKRPPDKEDYCSKIENGVQDFFRYLNKEKYIQHLKTDMDTYDRFKSVIMKLSSQPPIPAGEGMDSIIITRNIYHFYRLLDKNDLRLIREIMRNEADSLEIQLDLFYKWLMLGDRCPDPEETRPPLDVLYQYAGFFLNTIGGRAYLFRRPPHFRLLVSYYSLLIIHEADKRGKNRYGIDIFPEITPLAREMSIYPDFHFQNEYIHQLTELQNYYLTKR